MMMNWFYPFMWWFIGTLGYMMEFIGLLGLILLLIALISTRMEEAIET